jgi:hypothetical protein
LVAAADGVSQAGCFDCRARKAGEIVQAPPSWDQTWQVITTSAPWQWQFTTWLALLDHWQSLVAGLVALLAAVIALGGGELFARCKERRENDAILGSLAPEIRQLLSTLFETHGVFEKLTRANARMTARDLMKHTELRQPVAYPAAADKLGRLGPRLAGGVSAFYANIEHIKFSGKIVAADPSDILSPPDWEGLAALFVQACRNSLPLLDALPRDEADADIRAKIEGMGKSDQPRVSS